MSNHTKQRNTIEDKLYTVRRKQLKKSHISIKNENSCNECNSNICLYICPAHVYEKEEGKDKINIQYENCLECGTCRIACEMHNIEWANPTEGRGIAYQNS